MSKVTTELLIDQIERQMEDYQKTMRAIAKTDRNLAVNNEKLSSLSRSMEHVPESIIKHGLQLEKINKKIERYDRDNRKLKKDQEDLTGRISVIEKSNNGINLKTVEGWRKIVPYIILGGLSLWGLISEALKKLSVD